jgi:hypothetical protein
VPSSVSIDKFEIQSKKEIRNLSDSLFWEFLLRGGLRGKRVDDTFCVLDFFFKF